MRVAYPTDILFAQNSFLKRPRADGTPNSGPARDGEFGVGTMGKSALLSGIYFGNRSILFRVKSLIFISVALSSLLTRGSFAADTNKADAAKVIVAVAQADGELKGIPFADVVKATTGKKILSFDLTNEADRELLAKIGAAMDEVMTRMNATNSVAQKQKRINEVSSHFENEIKQVLNGTPGFSCDIPRLASGKVQRSGYPDLRLVDKKTGRIVYIDPKLYAQGSRSSSFRTFYFEPKTDTNKILDDACHLIVGFEHDGRKSGEWKFLSWELIDLSQFKVRLKAEFQGSNRDLYQEAAIVGTSRK